MPGDQHRKLRILHLSDLHERGPRAEDRWRSNRVLGDAFRRNLDELVSEGPIDLVCFTGDVAWSGKADEYGRATDFLVKELLEPLKLPVERFFPVPGNHDIDRDLAERAWDGLRANCARVDAVELGKWMVGNGKPPPGFAEGQREKLLSRQAAYRAWVGEILGRKDLLPGEKGRLGYRHTLRLGEASSPIDVHIIGLDSAWAAGGDDDAGKLLLTDEQVGRLTTEDGKPLRGLRLALVHHPLSDLFDQAAARRLIAENVDLLLRGHLHEAAMETVMDPARVTRELAAGCLYESDRRRNGCHVLELTLDGAGRPVQGLVRFRRWSEQGHWYDDGSLYHEASNGRLRWAFGQERNQSRLNETAPVPTRRPVATGAAPEPERQRSLDEQTKAAEQALARRRGEGQPVEDIKTRLVELKGQRRRSSRLQPGDILDGRYHLQERLGKGGFATVWKAYDDVRKELVAVKVLHVDKMHDDSQVERFFRGGLKMASLNHPAIVRVFQPRGESGEHCFFVMEYLAGGDLRDVVLKKRLDPARVIPIICEVGAGLEHAHRHGLVHRDVKPANIILDHTGRAKLTDFDLVRADDTAGGTRTDMQLGTFMYAAPECMAQAKEAGPPADIYSLGMTAIFAFHGADLPMKAFKRPEEFVGRLDCAEALKGVLLQAIDEEPGKRFGSCEQFCQALRRAAEGPPPLPVVSPPKYEVTGARRLLFLNIMRGTVHRAVERARAGAALDRLGDPRFEKNPWMLPDEELLGFVKIPVGRFRMGEGTEGHEVYLAEYYIGRYPVTVGQFGAYCRAIGMGPRDENALKGASNVPVAWVRWREAMGYCEWLTRELRNSNDVPRELRRLLRGEEGAKWRVTLPSEAEWEKAARGTDGRNYPWGNKWDVERANSAETGIGERSAVGCFLQGRSVYGVEEMSGNVWEWTRSLWDGYPYPQDVKGRTKREALTGDGYCVVRGGAFHVTRWLVRCAVRDLNLSVDHLINIGFRVALSPLL